jgi:hypothetical protein
VLLAGAALLLCLVHAPGVLAARQLPTNARFAVISQFQYPYLVVKGRTLHIAPGAKIYNEQNLIIMPAAMQAPANALLRLDLQGEVEGIWILTPQETARYKKPAFTSPGSTGGR